MAEPLPADGAPPPPLIARSPFRWLYLACGGLAAFFLVMIGVLIAASIVTRLLGINVRGLANYAGYSMAASSFLALAYTFGHGGHIRVMLILQRLRGRVRRVAEIWCLGVATYLAGYLAWYCVRLVQVSLQINDISQGTDATPLWIPQLALAIGASVFALAVAEQFVRVLFGAPLDEDRAATFK